jgi:hypothetical protein
MTDKTSWTNLIHRRWIRSHDALPSHLVRSIKFVWINFDDSATYETGLSFISNSHISPFTVDDWFTVIVTTCVDTDIVPATLKDKLTTFYIVWKHIPDASPSKVSCIELWCPKSWIFTHAPYTAITLVCIQLMLANWNLYSPVRALHQNLRVAVSTTVRRHIWLHCFAIAPN